MPRSPRARTPQSTNPAAVAARWPMPAVARSLAARRTIEERPHRVHRPLCRRIRRQTRRARRVAGHADPVVPACRSHLADSRAARHRACRHRAGHHRRDPAALRARIRIRTACSRCSVWARSWRSSMYRALRWRPVTTISLVVLAGVVAQPLGPRRDHASARTCRSHPVQVQSSAWSSGDRCRRRWWWRARCWRSALRSTRARRKSRDRTGTIALLGARRFSRSCLYLASCLRSAAGRRRKPWRGRPKAIWLLVIWGYWIDRHRVGEAWGVMDFVSPDDLATEVRARWDSLRPRGSRRRCRRRRFAADSVGGVLREPRARRRPRRFASCCAARRTCDIVRDGLGEYRPGRATRRSAPVDRRRRSDRSRRP